MGALIAIIQQLLRLFSGVAEISEVSLRRVIPAARPRRGPDANSWNGYRRLDYFNHAPESWAAP